jgi:drug/metabolite transporter (DMT)-like permease
MFGSSIMRNIYLPFLLLVVCSFLLAAKIMVAQAAISTGLRPFQLAILGNAGAAVVLLVFARTTGQTISWERRHLKLYLVLGIISFAVPTVVTYLVVDPVGPAYVSSLYALSPVLTMTLAALFGLEGLTARRTFGIFIGFVGMIALIQQKIVGIDFSAMFWVLLGLTVPLAAATGNIIRTAFWPSGASPLSFATATLLISSILLAAVGPLIENPATWSFHGEGQVFWLVVLIGVSALSYLLNYTFQKIAGPVVFSQIGYWGTGFGVILAAILFGDVLRVASLVGVVAIIAGGLLANRRTKKDTTVVEAASR